MTMSVAGIYRHPIKGHGREHLASAMLAPYQGLPWDRHWAVAHDAAKLDPGWNPCHNFARGAKAPALMAIESVLDTATGMVMLRHPDRGEISFNPDDPGDLARFLDWVRPLNPPDRAQPVSIVAAGIAMTDSDFPSISLLSTATCTELGDRMGMEIDPLRFRANILLRGALPFEEFDLVGKRIRIGKSVLEVVERIVRCRATMADPHTGVIDADTLAALTKHYGHQQLGIYARVIEGGEIRVEDDLVVV